MESGRISVLFALIQGKYVKERSHNGRQIQIDCRSDQESQFLDKVPDTALIIFSFYYLQKILSIYALNNYTILIFFMRFLASPASSS